MRKKSISGRVCVCDDCDIILMRRPIGFAVVFGGWDGDWFMVKDAVWRTATHGTAIRFLCILCLEERLGRKLVAGDFRRGAKVNFVGEKSALMRRRMRGLQPAKRLINTSFDWDRPRKRSRNTHEGAAR